MTAVAELTPSAATSREVERRAGSVFFAWLHGEDVRASFMASVMALLLGEHSALLGGIYELPTGPNLSVARNSAAAAFLKSPQEWLWFADSDTAFSPQALVSLLELADPERCPVIAACVPVTVHDPIAHNIGEWPELHWAIYSMAAGQLHPWPVKVPLSPVHQVDAAGTGFMLIHRSVIEATSPGPFNEWSEGSVQLGEDLAFCRKAAAAGFPIHAAGAVRVGHAKVVTL